MSGYFDAVERAVHGLPGDAEPRRTSRFEGLEEDGLEILEAETAAAPPVAEAPERRRAADATPAPVADSPRAAGERVEGDPARPVAASIASPIEPRTEAPAGVAASGAAAPVREERPSSPPAAEPSSRAPREPRREQAEPAPVRTVEHHHRSEILIAAAPAEPEPADAASVAAVQPDSAAAPEALAVVAQPAPLPPAPPEPEAGPEEHRSQPPEAPFAVVQIDRIEIRLEAESAPPAPVRARATPPPVVSLDSYLAGREGRGR